VDFDFASGRAPSPAFDLASRRLADHALAKGTKVTIDGGLRLPGGSAGPADKAGMMMMRRLAVWCVLIVAVIMANIMTAGWSLREQMLFAFVPALAAAVGVLLRRYRLAGKRLAAERRQLALAVDNIPQGLVLYDASARIVACNDISRCSVCRPKWSSRAAPCSG
jgi:PAS domain-containing protein